MVLLGGPTGLLIQSGERPCLDYAWLGQSLYTLFFECEPKDERFKGDLLEKSLHKGAIRSPRRSLPN